MLHPTFSIPKFFDILLSLHLRRWHEVVYGWRAPRINPIFWLLRFYQGKRDWDYYYCCNNPNPDGNLFLFPTIVRYFLITLNSFLDFLYTFKQKTWPWTKLQVKDLARRDFNRVVLRSRHLPMAPGRGLSESITDLVGLTQAQTVA